MKQIFVIGLILLQFLGFVSAEAKAPVQSPAKTETQKQGSTFSALLHQDHPADLTRLAHVHSPVFKVGGQRWLPGFANLSGAELLSFDRLQTDPVAPAPSSSHQMRRLLLFPNHYFW